MKHIFPKAHFEIMQINPKKYLGQNFLIDNNIIKRIVDISQLTLNDTILEIGPGFGVLTRSLSENAGSVISIEKDVHLYNYIKDNFQDLNNLQMINADFLKVELKKIIGNKKIKIVSNLPYSVASQVIFKLIESGINIDRMILMVQKETGERICSLPNNKTYGAFSVLVQSYMDTKIRMKVSPNSFWPKPNVDSVVIELIPREPTLLNKDERILFNNVVKSAFHSRRKKMINNLKALLEFKKLKEIFIELGLDENVRAEALSLLDFIYLAKALIKYDK